MTLPNISSYGQYASSNYGCNTHVVELPLLRIYYSYQTIIAFYHPSTNLIVRKNDWGSKTGKHLNWIDGGNKNNRIPSEKFEVMLKEVLK